MNALSVVMYGSLLVAVVACVAAVASPHVRARALALAGFFYGVAGVLGILSIGLLFLVAAALCFALAARVNASEQAPHA